MILFIGNSYTFVNDLDAVTESAFEAAGTDVDTTRLATAGYRFADHVVQTQVPGSAWEEALITGSTDWSYVILQEQSQIPGFPHDNPEWALSLSSAKTLDGLVRDNHADTLLLVTWGRRDGDPGNPEMYPDYPTMQAALVEGYRAYAAELSTDERPVFVAPVGLAWQRIYDASADPLAHDSLFWRLYADDGSHPSPAGTYLAACVLYATLTGDSPEGLPSDLPDAPALQEAAARAVLDDPSGQVYPWELDDPVGEPVDTDVLADGHGCDTSGRSGAWILGLLLVARRRR
jgi:hypothetical protein